MSFARRFAENTDAVIDWMLDGAWPIMTAKTLAVTGAGAALLIGAVAAPIRAIQNNNTRNAKETADMIDKGPSAVFFSTEDCVKKDFSAAACLASEKEALDVASSMGTHLSYKAAEDCVASHQSCNLVKRFTMYGKVPITTWTYDPPVIGWQALQSDLNRAIPLYDGPEPGSSLRFDGDKLKYISIAT